MAPGEQTLVTAPGMGVDYHIALRPATAGPAPPAETTTWHHEVMPRVSVIVPAYDPGPFLLKALESLLDQSFEDWEALVVDDGSHESLSWVEALDERIRLIRQPNRGLSNARNRGIRESSGPLLAFLDADDFWLPNKMELQVSEMEAHPDLVLLSTMFELIDAHGTVTGSGFEGNFDSYQALLGGCGICVSTVMLQRSALESVGLFDEGLRAVQDWDLWLRLARLGRIDRLAQSLAHYRVHPSSMSRNWRTTYREGVEVLHRHEDQGRDVGLAHIRLLASHHALDAARAAHLEGDHRTVLVNLVHLAQLSPKLLLTTARQRQRS